MAFRAAVLVAAAIAMPAWSTQTYCDDRKAWADVQRERKAWVQKLGERRYAELDKHYGGLQTGYEAAARSDAELAAWYDAFDFADPRYTPYFEEWMAKFPDSYPARRAYAQHLFATAWAKRGGKFESETSDEQMRGMKVDLERMVDVLNGADPKVRRPIASYPLRIHLARTLVGPREVLALYERAERIDARNAMAKRAFIWAGAPKWRGDTQRVLDIAAAWEASDLPPALKKYLQYEVLMMVADDRRLDGKREAAIKSYEEASRLCPAFDVPLERLLGLYRDTDNSEGARETAERYLETHPTSGWAHAKLAAALSRLKRMPESFRSYERAAQLGDRTGMEGVAWHYARGEGVKRDAERALELYNQVYDRGGTHVKPQIERLKLELRK